MEKICYRREIDKLNVYCNDILIAQYDDTKENEEKILKSIESSYNSENKDMKKKLNKIQKLLPYLEEFSNVSKLGSPAWLLMTILLLIFKYINIYSFGLVILAINGVFIIDAIIDKKCKELLEEEKEIEEHLKKFDMLTFYSDELNNDNTLELVKYINPKLFKIIENNKYKTIPAINISSISDVSSKEVEILKNYGLEQPQEVNISSLIDEVESKFEEPEKEKTKRKLYLM